jgi:hypothetical protein
MCRAPGSGAQHLSGRNIVPTDRRPSYVRRAATAAALSLAVATGLLAGSGLAAAAPPTTRVTNTDIAPACVDGRPASTTGYCTELHGAGTAAVVDDVRAEVGHGYLRFSTLASADHATTYVQRFAGMKLKDINDLAFETLIEQAPAGNKAAPSINIEIAPNKVGVTGPAATFSTLVWEPTYTGATITTGSWQHWTPSTSAGGWWATRTVTNSGTPNAFGFNTYTATFAEVKAALPDAVIGALAVNQGSGNTGLVAGVDALRVNNRIYDFDNGPRTADLGMTIAAPLNARQGATITVTVTVTNSGRADSGAVNTAVVFSPGLRVLSAPGGFGYGSVAAYRTPSLGAGKSVSFAINLAVDARARGTLSVFGSTHSPVRDPNTLNNLAGASIVVRG